ncbi:MAG: sigma-54-dependent Fis family transcriptional regulator [Porticoccaceae bacterium]|jgi:two-component system response regulator FlrC|nr:sigma-54-dependent Fis family transcriptional regulator [Porticoccaceae bacterium]
MTSTTILWIDSHKDSSTPELTELETEGFDLAFSMPCDLTDGQILSAQAIVISLEQDTALLTSIQQQQAFLKSNAPIIVRVDRGNFELGILAMRNGAATVVPTQQNDVKDWLEIFSIVNLDEFDQSSASAFVFADPISRNLLALTERVAKVDVTVLLSGSTGSGKEVIARILHDASPRHAGPFVAFNCAAMPENLIEDILFGHEKGSFTGASNIQHGLFEQAQGGTIFLDEIGEIPFHLQAKLLRILQERCVTRLGGSKAIDLDIRVVAATNRNLKEAIYDRTFREDLYFRLSTFKITLPNLEQRPLDIIPLAKQFIQQQADNNLRYTLSEDAEASLLAYPWPGNVRELQNVITRAIVLAQQETIRPEHLIFDDIAQEQTLLQKDVSAMSMGRVKPFTFLDERRRKQHEPESLSNSVKNSEYETIMAALGRARNRDQAAEFLGISTRTLRHKLQRLREQGMSVNRAYAR